MCHGNNRKSKNAFINSNLEQKEEFDFYKIEDLDQSKNAYG